MFAGPDFGLWGLLAVKKNFLVFRLGLVDYILHCKEF